MKFEFKSLFDLQSAFPDEQSCIDHLEKGTIYQFTLDTRYSIFENIKKATSKRKSSFNNV